ncbi:MAG: DUF6090 family protein [Flavobacteriaceae bacterium]
MIKFLRNIRKKLIEQHKVRNYIFYAIGEILLVVIGILIALSINNWNENQKTSAKIKSILIALQSDLVQDTILINNKLPGIIQQLELNEALRSRVTTPEATLDTLVKITRFEFNPNWSNQIVYNTNAYNSLNQTGLIENLSDSLKSNIKNFYSNKLTLNLRVERITIDYRNKVASFVDTYSFGSTELHDQGELIDSLIWKEIDASDLAAKFQGITNFKRIQFRMTREELEYSLIHSRNLLKQLDLYIKSL